MTVKDIFDGLHQNKEQIESDFWSDLNWQRLEEKRASRVCHTLEGGWDDEVEWPALAQRVVKAMTRLFEALSP